MVGLDAADRNQRVGAGRDSIGHDVFELPDLIAAEGQAGIAVVALGKDVDHTAEMRGEALQVLDRRRAEGQRIAGEFFKHDMGLQQRVSLSSTYSKLYERCCLTPGRRAALWSRRSRPEAAAVP